jgi:hypothetical protein
MQRAPDAKPKPNVVSFTQYGGSSTIIRCTCLRTLAAMRLVATFAPSPTSTPSWSDAYLHSLARWLVSLAGKSSSSSALKQRTEFAASGSPRKRRRRSWRRLSRRPQPTTLSLINYFFLFWPPFFFLGV